MRSVNLDVMQITLFLGRKCMTRRELCKLTGITEANMSTIIKRGTAAPKTAGLIAAALGVDIEEIVKLPEETQ